MEASRFDALTRHLVMGLSRRRSLGILAAMGLVGLVSPDAAEAKKKKKPCPPCKKRKQGKCKKKLPDGTACAGGSCQGGRCVAATPPPTGSGPVPPVCGAGKACAGADDCFSGGTCECKVRSDNPNVTCCGNLGFGCGLGETQCSASDPRCPPGTFCTQCAPGAFFCAYNCT
jgi:hypothetical protein